MEDRIAVEQPVRVEDSQYYYRVDGLQGLRALYSDQYFAPARWDVGERPWPHAPLKSALERNPPENGLYLVCFWINEAAGRRDLAARSILGDRNVLLRVPRLEVARALSGWTCEPDDYLPSTADMFWASVPWTTQDEHRLCGGIPLERFEAWSEQRGWQPWAEAELLFSTPVRMRRAGWHPATVPTWGHDVPCHWQFVDLLTSKTAETWCLVVPDRDRTTLGVITWVRLFAANMLGCSPTERARALAGILVVGIFSDRLILEPFRFARDRFGGGAYQAFLSLFRPAVPKAEELMHCERFTHSDGMRLLECAGLTRIHPEVSRLLPYAMVLRG